MRIRHIPTDIAVKCTRERSQLQNKAIALEMLKVRGGPCALVLGSPIGCRVFLRANCHLLPGLLTYHL